MNKSLLEDIGSLYNHITIQDTQILNEESEYYNQELTELVEDIIATISYSMISEGCSASGVVDFLANAPEQDIVEYYFNCTLGEGVVSEEYIQEQLEILNEGIPFGLIGKAFGAGLKNAGRVANIAVKRMAGPGVRKAVGGAVGKIKDIAKGAKAALPAVAKGAGILGLGAAGGYVGAKVAGAGGGSPTAKTAPSGGAVKDLAAYNAGGGGSKSKTAGMGTADVENLGRSNLFKAGGGAAKMQKAGLTKQQVMDLGSKNVANKKSVKPAAPAPAPSAPGSPSGKSSAPAVPAPAKDKTWTFNNKQVTDAEVNKKYDELKKTNPKAAVDFGRNVNSQKYGKPTQGPADAQIDTKSVEADLKAQQERDKKRAEASTPKESYDAYDLVLDYLFETGQVDTISEAHYVMLEMDSETIGSIVEAKTPKKWIQGAIKNPGALSKKLGVPEDENIPATKLAAAAKKPGKTGRQARLAMTLKNLKK